MKGWTRFSGRREVWRAACSRVGRSVAAVDTSLRRTLRSVLDERSGQGTTEYAILVGVLVVIAIVAIVAFRGKVQELWSAITSGINSL